MTSPPTALPPIRALIAHLKTALPVGWGEKPANAGTRYAVVAADAGEAQMYTLSRVDQKLDIEVDVEAVATSAEQAIWTQDKIRSTLHDANLVVPGRDIKPIRQTGVGPLLRDDSVAPPVFSVIATYRLSSHPA